MTAAPSLNRASSTAPPARRLHWRGWRCRASKMGFATSGGLSKSAKVVLIRQDDPVAVSNVNRNPYRTRRRLGMTRAADTARDANSLAIRIPRTRAPLSVRSPMYRIAISRTNLEFDDDGCTVPILRGYINPPRRYGLLLIAIADCKSWLKL